MSQGDKLYRLQERVTIVSIPRESTSNIKVEYGQTRGNEMHISASNECA